jgi:hypothetical protein
VPRQRTFRFRSRLEKITRGGPYYAVSIPQQVSEALGGRGAIPVRAEINGVADVRASLVPSGGGRHRLRLNQATRIFAGIAVGAQVSVVLQADPEPALESMPGDLKRALQREAALAAFEWLPVGRRRHIVAWIEQAVRDTTRDKRIARAVEVALAVEERRLDRANHVVGSGKLGPLDDRMQPRAKLSTPRPPPRPDCTPPRRIRRDPSTKSRGAGARGSREDPE